MAPRYPTYAILTPRVWYMGTMVQLYLQLYHGATVAHPRHAYTDHMDVWIDRYIQCQHTPYGLVLFASVLFFALLELAPLYGRPVHTRVEDMCELWSETLLRDQIIFVMATLLSPPQTFPGDHP